MSGPGHGVAELQRHGGRPGVWRVVRGEGVVGVVGVVAVPASHDAPRTHPVDQRVALGELLVHPAGAVVVWWPARPAVAVVAVRLLPRKCQV